MANDNKTIGRFHLDGIPPAQRGVPQIEVTFDIDANGIIKVSATDKATNKTQDIRIEASSGLTEEEIQKMKQEAEANAESDKKAKEKVDKLNEADSMIFQTEKQLKEYGDKLSAGNKSNIENALTELRTAHGSKDVAGIDRALENLNNAWSAASQEMYAATQGQPGGAPGADGQGNGQAGGPQGATADGGVTDVDYEEVDGSKQ